VASAAKKAEVELFVPSEFAFVSEGVRGEGFIGLKQEVVDHLVEIGLSYLRIFVSTAVGNLMLLVIDILIGWNILCVYKGPCSIYYDWESQCRSHWGRRVFVYFREGRRE
jgi:hypothetical protein